MLQRLFEEFEEFILPGGVSLILHIVVFAFVSMNWRIIATVDEFFIPDFSTISAELVDLSSFDTPIDETLAVPTPIPTQEEGLGGSQAFADALSAMAEDIESVLGEEDGEEDGEGDGLGDDEGSMEEEIAIEDLLPQEELAVTELQQLEELQRLQELEKLDVEERERLLQQQQELAVEQRVVAQYSRLIQQQVERKWERPYGVKRGMKARITIQLVPSGKIVAVEISRSSGNGAFDRSAYDAIRKIRIFRDIAKLPRDIFDKYFNRFVFEFQPEDLS